MSAPHLQHLAALIANDGHASSFQSLGQYRTALLKEIAQASAAPEQEMVGALLIDDHFDSSEVGDVDVQLDSKVCERLAVEHPGKSFQFYIHHSAEIERLRSESAAYGAAIEAGLNTVEILESQLAEAQALLQRTRRDLDACQKVIWLAGVGARGYGFDPAYCEDAQARLTEIDAFLSATAQPAEDQSNE